ncbi:hypothetical protein [Nocardioides sp. MH1]|uniref:hypothetical protein n=1 Tax=Nocardioides sp. MH1 TaxID=3242490 RepID=UPI003521A1EC
MTPGSPGEQGRRGPGNLNAILYVVVVLCLGAVVVLTAIMWDTYRSEATSDTSGGFAADAWNLVKDKRIESAGETRVGEDVGDGTVQKMDLASEAEQVRAADQIEAATKMVNAFLNIQYQHVDANIAAVKALASGAFLKQYNHASDDLEKLTRRAKATQTGEVVWAGLVSGDKDSADVVLATNGTVSNKVTDFKEQARSYRLQLHLELVDGQWLTSDLQYVN